MDDILKKKISNKYLIIDKLDDKKIKELYGDDFDSFIANLLYVRGVKNKKEAEKFLNPKWEDNFNPFDFKDMKKAVNRILQAIDNNENILIFSDYDADGVPGGAIFHDFFRKIKYDNFRNFIPHREKDGYGLSEKLAKKIVEGKIFQENEIEKFEEFKASLVVTIDSGIQDLRAGEILKKNKIDLIITDHHEPSEELPKAFSILNHKIKDSGYQESILCGAGVIFKLIQALFIEARKKKIEWVKDIPEGWEKWLLDLVAISTVADMVPLLGENRIFVKYGKKVLEKTPRVGLRQIIKKSRLSRFNISTTDIGFMIGPRINAASRLGGAEKAFKALLGGIYGDIESADNLEKINNKRKGIVAKIMREVNKKNDILIKKNVIVLGNPDWPVGVVGLIAGRVADKFKKPVFVWTEGVDSSIVKGSCRSGSNVDVFSLMTEAGDIFENFGGHSAAGGFSLLKKNIFKLEDLLNEKIEQAQKRKEDHIFIDEIVTMDDVHMKHYKELEKFEPFGLGNPKPIFLFQNTEIFSRRDFGKNGNHLELSFLNTKGVIIKAISFNFKDKIGWENLKSGDKINLLASMELNTFNGANYLRLKIEDIIL